MKAIQGQGIEDEERIKVIQGEKEERTANARLKEGNTETHSECNNNNNNKKHLEVEGRNNR